MGNISKRKAFSIEALFKCFIRIYPGRAVALHMLYLQSSPKIRFVAGVKSRTQPAKRQALKNKLQNKKNSSVYKTEQLTRDYKLESHWMHHIFIKHSH